MSTSAPEPDHEGGDQGMSLHELHSQGVEVEGMTPEEERKSDHPTPNHTTGRLEP